MFFIECNNYSTAVIDCQILYSSYIFEMIYYALFALSSVGTITNLLALATFIVSRDMNTKFLLYMKWYLVNSLIITANFLASFLPVHHLMFTNNLTFYNYYLYNSYVTLFCFRFVYLPIWTITYTYGILFDILIAYERILIYKPRLQSLRNVKVYTFIFSMFVFSFVCNLPANMLRDIKEYTLSFNGTIKTAYYIGVYDSFDNSLFLVFLYIGIFLRDILTLIVELSITVFLIITIVRIQKMRSENLRISNKRDNKELNNSKITLIICLVSAFNHIQTFVSILALLFLGPYVTYVIDIATTILLLVKNSVNLFIFLRLNKKFRHNFLWLVSMRKRTIQSNPSHSSKQTKVNRGCK